MTDITFFSFISTGLRAAGDTFTADAEGRVPVRLSVVAHPSGTTHTVNKVVELYRPCDVLSIDPKAVFRTDPDHRTRIDDFEPNYLPTVEFAAADLPWRFSLESPSQGRWMPWLALVALEEGEFEDVSRARSGRAPRPAVIRIRQPSLVLPPASQVGAWAHAQGMGDLASADETDLETLDSSGPTKLRARLVAARRLRPRTRYRACLIPTFECGRLRGLSPLADHEHVPGPAWSDSSPPDLEFPVYFAWDFATSRAGDIEALAERIEPKGLASSTGTRPLQIPAQEYEVPATPEPMRYDGALVSTELENPPEQPEPTTSRLVEVLNAPHGLGGGDDDVDLIGAPAVAPPIYGQWHKSQRRVSSTPATPETGDWVSELNTYLPYRAAAGLGAEVVRRNQESLVAEAWRQVGDVIRANERIHAAQLGYLASTRLFSRSVERLPKDVLLLISRPLHMKLRAEGQTTLTEELASSKLRGLAESARLRSALAPRGLARRFFQSPSAAFSVGEVIPTIAISERVTGAAPEIADAALTAFVVHESGEVAGPGSGGVALGPGTVAGPDTGSAVPGLSAAEPDLLKAVDVSTIGSEILGEIRPAISIPKRVNALIDGIQVGTIQTLCNVVLPAPEFDNPMYAALRDISASHVLPGLGDIPSNTAALLNSNQSFIEAYMAGLNYEMASELLWRGYPATDLGATYFQHFWDSGSDFVDITKLHTWSSGLGANRAASGPQQPLVLLLRADLIRRYPGLLIYAQPASINPVSGDFQLGSASDDEVEVVLPIFRGDLLPDTVVVGFDLTEQEVRGGGDDPGFFFVLEEQPRDARFGLDEPQGRPVAGDWSDITWADVAPVSHTGDEEWHGPVDLEAPTAASLPTDPRWNRTAAAMAEILYQQPYRIAIHARRLLPPGPPS